MDKIFTKTVKTLLYGLLSPPSPSKLICKNWDPAVFLLYDVKLHGTKIEKTDDPEILNSVPNLFSQRKDDINFQLQYGGTFL